MTSYPSDISRAQFKKIRSLLEAARKHTRPRTLDLHDVFNALLYVMKTGCQWRALPKDYPDYRSVHHYFRIWSEVPEGHKETALERVLKKIGRAGAYKKWQEAQDFFLRR
jgi:transposase